MWKDNKGKDLIEYRISEIFFFRNDYFAVLQTNSYMNQICVVSINPAQPSLSFFLAFNF